MVSRNKNGRLSFASLDFEIMIGEMFSECNNEREIEWLTEQLQSTVECMSEERLNELES